MTLRHQHWLALFGGMMKIRRSGGKGTVGGQGAGTTGHLWSAKLPL